MQMVLTVQGLEMLYQVMREHDIIVNYDPT